LQLAAERGLAVVVMEPLRGGQIVKDPPPIPVAEAFDKSDRDWTPVAWALHWLWDQPGVSTVLSGMSAMEQVEENLAVAAESAVGIMTDADHALIDAVRNAYASMEPIPCTQCEYCLPCPSGVAIPRIFDVYNEAVAFDAWGHGRWVYKDFIKPEEQADNCTECGECEAICPQNIKIINWLATAHEKLTQPAG
jgi:predicted aldo/keto reductase-like oxidoreductase